MTAERSSFGLGAALAYAAVIAYGTLYPFDNWSLPVGLRLVDLLPAWPSRISRTDLLTNILSYVPLGILTVWGLRPRARRAATILIATAGGSALGLTLEVVQAALPARVASLSDLVANGAGTLGGAIAAVALSPSLVGGRWIARLRSRWIKPGADANLAVAVFGLWALSQLSPLIPSADLGNLKKGLKPLWMTLRDPSRFELQHAAVYALAVGGLALLGAIFIRRQPGRWALLVSFVYAVLLLKVPVVTRHLSLEAVVGAALGFFLLAAARQSVERSATPKLAAIFVLGAFALDGLRAPEATGQVLIKEMSWIPFARYRLNLYDIAGILGNAWHGLALGYAIRCATPRRRQPAVAVGGALLLLGVAFAIEWTQQQLPGRTPDLTDCLVILAAWTVPFVRASARRSRRVGDSGTASSRATGAF